MHGLADIRAMNDRALTDELARRRRLAAKREAYSELEEARKVHKRLLVWQAAYQTNTELSQLMQQAAELIDSAYGVSED